MSGGGSYTTIGPPAKELAAATANSQTALQTFIPVSERRRQHHQTFIPVSECRCQYHHYHDQQNLIQVNLLATKSYALAARPHCALVRNRGSTVHECVVHSLSFGHEPRTGYARNVRSHSFSLQYQIQDASRGMAMQQFTIRPLA